MNTQIKKQIAELACKTPDIEICGFIYYNSSDEIKLYQAKNISVSSTLDFEIDPVDYLRCDNIGVIIGVYHSHPGDEESFSEADIYYAEEVGVPLYLYTVGTGKLQEYIPPTYEIDLIGLPFIWGLYDCYSIIRNGLRQRCQIYLSDYDRDSSFAQDITSKSLIINKFEEEGFEIIGRGRKDATKLQENDAILFTTPSLSRVLPIHLGLYVGNSMFIHHPEGALSSHQQLNQHWLDRISFIVRHKKLIK